MPGEDLIARIEEVVKPVLRDHGVELVDLEWRGHGARGVLRLFIDKAGGVRIDDCERVSREVGYVLDAEDVIVQRYDLEVSSPGLDRPLRSDREYRWAIGKRVRCVLADGREVEGRLATADAEVLVVETDGGPVDVLRAEVRKARLEPDVPWPRESVKR
jgi:ribosome maturation factor RimP